LEEEEPLGMLLAVVVDIVEDKALELSAGRVVAAAARTT
jgi:hypothetical protein